MDNSLINRNFYGFNKQSMQKRMESLGLSSFNVYEGSGNSVMLCEFNNFSKECIKHKTSIPFFEIIDISSRSNYTHFINENTIKRDAKSSGISFYTSQIQYGLEIKSGDSINCDLLGINPVFFNNWLGGYQLSKLLPDHLKDIQDKNIQELINHIAFLCKKLPFRVKPSIIDEQTILLLQLVAQKYLHLPNKCRFTNHQIKDITEYIDEKVKTNKSISLEVLIDQFVIEYPVYWVNTFKANFGTTPYQYYISRKTNVLSTLKEEDNDYYMLAYNQKKLFQLLHELVENPKSISALDYQNSQEENLIPFLLEKLGYKSKGTFKNHCSNLKIKPLNYYNFLRIEKAKQLLITTPKDIAEISYDCGFNDVDHFHRHFRNRVNNISPEEFRSKYKQTPIYF